MKQANQIQVARDKLAATLVKHHAALSKDQKTLLAGMVTALAWVSDAGGSTLQRLLDGEEIVAGTAVEDVSDRTPFWMKEN